LVCWIEDELEGKAACIVWFCCQCVAGPGLWLRRLCVGGHVACLSLSWSPASCPEAGPNHLLLTSRCVFASFGEWCCLHRQRCCRIVQQQLRVRLAEKSNRHFCGGAAEAPDPLPMWPTLLVLFVVGMMCASQQCGVQSMLCSAGTAISFAPAVAGVYLTWCVELLCLQVCPLLEVQWHSRQLTQ